MILDIKYFDIMILQYYDIRYQILDIKYYEKVLSST